MKPLSGDADLYDVGGRYGKILGLADFNNALDCLLDVFKVFFPGFSLGDAPWKRRAFRHDVTIFSLSESDQVFVSHGFPLLIR